MLQGIPFFLFQGENGEDRKTFRGDFHHFASPGFCMRGAGAGSVEKDEFGRRGKALLVHPEDNELGAFDIHKLSFQGRILAKSPSKKAQVFILLPITQEKMTGIAILKEKEDRIFLGARLQPVVDRPGIDFFHMGVVRGGGATCRQDER